MDPTVAGSPGADDVETSEAVPAAVTKPATKWHIPVTAAGTFDVSALRVTEAQQAAIALLPQGSPEWLQARWGRVTASNFGTAAGCGPPGAKPKLLQAMLWPETHAGLSGFGARAAAHGTSHEAVARDLYHAHRTHVAKDGLVALWETGLLVSVKHGWCGASPDFLLTEYVPDHEDAADADAFLEVDGSDVPVQRRYMIMNGATRAAAKKAAAAAAAAPPPATVDPRRVVRGCGEIKCPFTDTLYGANPKHAATGGFPAYYYAQIQALMAQEDLAFCDAVVYTSLCTDVRRFPRNPAYFDTYLFPAVQAFYFDEFVPRVNARLQGRLKRGEVDPIAVVPHTRAHALLQDLLDSLVHDSEAQVTAIALPSPA